MAGETNTAVVIGKSFNADTPIKDELLDLKLANRHGLITGATGTGKTVTLQVLAEGFSRAGVPVFASDIKGDLSGLSQMGVPKDFLTARAQKIGYTDYTQSAFPAIYWDLFGKQGHPMRATLKEMGPLIVSRLLDLNEVQEGVINIVYRVAEDENLPLIDLDDLRALLFNVSQRGDEISQKYGNVGKTSVGAVQRQLLVLEAQGGGNFFGNPALDINDFMRTTPDGRGIINVLVADQLMQSPQLYATFLLWLMSELFSKLPEVGDPTKPKLVFFFDEAHLLFDQAPDALLTKIEQVTRLIRSKGVGVYYVTQNPLDVPDSVSSQLGNRVQHALRAFTPREQKAVRAAAETFRPNPDIDTARAIMELGVGEALVSTLEGKGTPSMVQRTLIRPPSGRLGPVTPEERKAVIAASPLFGKYETKVVKATKAEMRADAGGGAAAGTRSGGGLDIGPRGGATGPDVGTERHGEFRVPPAPGNPSHRPAESSRERAPAAPRRQTEGEAFRKSMWRSLGTAAGQIAGAVIKGMLGRR
jgi:uncharacterized protein